MRIIKVTTLKAFYEQYPDARQSIEAWIVVVKQATWKSPNDVKITYGDASIIGNERVVFNIRGNNYRLIAAISYRAQLVLIKFIGTHASYDKIDAEHVG